MAGGTPFFVLELSSKGSKVSKGVKMMSKWLKIGSKGVKTVSKWWLQQVKWGQNRVARLEKCFKEPTLKETVTK